VTGDGDSSCAFLETGVATPSADGVKAASGQRKGHGWVESWSGGGGQRAR
jgi:hypothetical protein